MNDNVSKKSLDAVKYNKGLSYSFALLLFVEVIFFDYIDNASIILRYFPIILFVSYFLIFYGRFSVYAVSIALLLISFYFLIQISIQEGFFGFLNILVAMMLGTAVAKNLVYSKHVLALIVVFLIVIIYKGFVIYLDGGKVNNISNQIAINASRNLISISLLFLTTLYYFVSKIESNDFLIMPALFCFVVAIFAGGRSGIISSVMLLIIVFFFSLRHNIRRILINSILFLLLIPIIFLFAGKFNIVVPYDIRIEFLTQFFQSYKFINLFSGLDITSLPIMEDFGGNIHNSFLLFLARFGMGAVLFFFLLALSTLFFISRRDFFPIFIILPFMLRMTTDTGLFMSIYDLLFYSYFILSLGGLPKYRPCRSRRV
jgi:hypothetical protein